MSNLISNGNVMVVLSQEQANLLNQLLAFPSVDNQSQAVTLRLFAEEYDAYLKNFKSKSYRRSHATSMGHLQDYFTPQRILSTITKKDAVDFMQVLMGRMGEGYRNYYRNFKAAFNVAVEWNYLNSNPFVGIKLPKRQIVKPEFINAKQLAEIQSSTHLGLISDIAELAFHTGLRRGEIVSLHWGNINFEKELIQVGDEVAKTKSRKYRVIPMTNRVKEILEKRFISRFKDYSIIDPITKEMTDKYVFYHHNNQPYSGDYISKKFKEARERAGLSKNVKVHSLRHSFASFLSEQNTPLNDIKELMGHSSLAVTQIYLHSTEENKRRAIANFNTNQKEGVQL